jgi:hypothetical protein
MSWLAGFTCMMYVMVISKSDWTVVDETAE